MLKGIIGFVLASGLAASASAGDITVTFKVHPPAHFRQSSAIFITGNHDQLGNWIPNGVALHKVSDQEWFAQVQMPLRFPIALKLTLGDWDHVEVDDQNQLIDNRKFVCSASCEIIIEPENFRITPFHKKPVAATGHIEYFHEVPYEEFHNTRSVAVYLPPHYDRSGLVYPVLYAADGQNLFDRATASFGTEWELDKTLDKLIQQGQVPPVIVVGMYSTDHREQEYLMNSKYVEFITKTVKPFIDQRYRTQPDRDHTFFLGSSWGANLGLYAGWEYSSYFSRLALVSGDYHWSNSKIIQMLDSVRPQFMPDKIWMDMGDHEDGDMEKPVEGLEMAYEHLIRNGVAIGSIHKEVIVGGIHKETAWSQRVDRILRFLL